MEGLAKGVTKLGVEERMESDHDEEEEELETPIAVVRTLLEGQEEEADLPTRSKKLRMESPEAMDEDEEILEEVHRGKRIKMEKAKRLAVIKALVILVNELYRKGMRKEVERIASAGKKELESRQVKEVVLPAVVKAEVV